MIALGMWLRHRPTASVWCAVATVTDHHATTECAGSLAISDADEFAVTTSPLPGERCAQCVRVVEARAVLAGLDELERSTRPGARLASGEIRGGERLWSFKAKERDYAPGEHKAVSPASQSLRGIVQLDLSDVDVPEGLE